MNKRIGALLFVWFLEKTNTVSKKRRVKINVMRWLLGFLVAAVCG